MDNKDLIDALNVLLETSKDGEYGFRATAEHVRGADLRTLFNRRADQCRDAAAELRTVIAQNGGKADDGGTVSGAIHRGWVAVKGTLTGYSDVAMLEECERGEDAALERYRGVIAKDLPPSVRSLVERQYEGVKRNHAEVRTLRNQARTANS